MVERDGSLIMVDDERLPLAPRRGRRELRTVRFRTLGCYPLTGAIESDGDDAAGDHRGDAARRRPRSGRAGSSITTEPASMEQKKQEGYF